MEYCEVYELVQQSLIDKKYNCNDSREAVIINNQIMRNAIVLVQLYKYIDRGERDTVFLILNGVYLTTSRETTLIH